MCRLSFTLAALLMAHIAVADRVVVFNPQDIWPEPVCMETDFGPMPLGYYIITQDDVEIEFQIDEELENMHDAYYFRGKMNIYSNDCGIKKVSFCCLPTYPEASFTLLYESNYNYTQSTVTGDVNTMVFEFFDTFQEYVGLEGNADISAIAVNLDDDGSTSILEEVDTRAVEQVRYFNVEGQEMMQPRGLTIKLTTYADGTTSVEKCVK